ncbi:MAG TPA: rod shape-determining protein MreD [Actinomycetota bacterium]|nr:rod shape-determining protein MreD [Actinomycetota bacterium]
MRRVIGTSALIVLGLVVQTTVMPHLALFRVVPDLLLVVVICVGLVEGPSAGAVAGFGGGLLRDFLLNAPTGLSALAYLSVGYAVGAIRPYVQSSSFLVPFAGVFLGSLAGNTLYIGLSLLLGVPSEPLVRVVEVLVLSAIYNTLLVPFVYPLARKLATEPSSEAIYSGRPS